MLEQTLELLAGDQDLCDALRATLEGAGPLAKPTDHRGNPATDMFRIDLDAETAGRICDCVTSAAETGTETSGTRGRGLGGFVEAWRECSDASAGV